MAGVLDIAMLLIILGGAYWVIKSGALNAIQPIPQQPVAVAPAAGGDNTTPTTTDGTTTTTPTTTTPTSTGNPLLDALNDLLGGNTNTQNTLPTTGGQPIPGAPVIPTGPIYQPDNPAECSSKYHGKCDTECASGNASLCNACQIACGGAAVGAVQTLPSQGSTNPSLCQSKYHGKCNTECQGGNSSECQACKAACGSFGAWAYYVKTPQSLIASSVFGNDNHAAYAAWGDIVVQNAK